MIYWCKATTAASKIYQPRINTGQAVFPSCSGKAGPQKSTKSYHSSPKPHYQPSFHRNSFVGREWKIVCQPLCNSLISANFHWSQGRSQRETEVLYLWHLYSLKLKSIPNPHTNALRSPNGFWLFKNKHLVPQDWNTEKGEDNRQTQTWTIPKEEEIRK